MTAAVSLYLTLGLPEPWRPTHTCQPLIIYGASGAVGSFAIQLAQLSNIHPIIAVAGKAMNHVESLIDRSKGDTICDYRNGDDALVLEMQAALRRTGHCSVYYALDCMSEKKKGSYPNILRVLDPKGHICLTQNYDPDDFPKVTTHTRMTVRWVHQDINMYAGFSLGPETIHSLKDSVTGGRDFGFLMFRFFGRALEKGFLKGHPQEVVPGGLGGIESALEKLKSGQTSAVKYVFRIEETEAISRLNSSE